MLVENLDALRAWLSETLTPLCEAEPATLTQYVIALIKKDKPEEDLYNACKTKLQVFLQDKTKDFVNVLFEALKSKSYLSSLPSTAEVTENNYLSADTADQSNNITSTTQAANNRDVSTEVHSTNNAVVPANNTRRSSTPPPVASREVHSPVNGRQRSPIYRDYHIKDRSPHRTSPVRDLRDRISHSYRDEKDRRYNVDDRRRDANRDWDRKGRYRSRYDSRRRHSPVWRRSRSRERIVNSRRRSHTRSRSPSPPHRVYPRSRSRTRSRTPPRYHRRSNTPDSRGSTPGLEEGSLRDALPPEKRPRCRDFDEKGFCMKGNMCEFDHGMDPVIVDDVALPNGPPPFHGAAPIQPQPPQAMPLPPMDMSFFNRPMMNQPPTMFPPPPGLPPPEVLRGPPPNVGLPMMMPPRQLPPQPMPPMDCPVPIGNVPNQAAPAVPSFPTDAEEPYNPESPAFSQAGQAQNVTNAPIYIPSKAKDDSAASSSIPLDPEPVVHVSAGKRQFPYQGSYRGGIHKKARTVLLRQNTSLTVQKIPEELNNIAKLNEHFGKFGTIVNLQIKFNGDPSAALVTFQYPSQATSAFRSTEPIFNNRFIRTFWYNKDGDNDDAKSAATPGIVAKQPKPVVTIPHHSKMHLNNLVNSSQDNGGTDNVSAAEAISTTVPTQPTLATAKAVDRNTDVKKEALKKIMLLQKKKQELLQKQLEEQKSLIKALEKKTLNPEEKANIMKMIKFLAERIEKLKTELEVTVSAKSSALTKTTSTKTTSAAKPSSRFYPSTTGPAGIAKTKQQTQKIILDTELELYAKESSGVDTSELRERVNTLRQKAKMYGILETSERGWFRGRGRSRGRGRGRGMGGRGGSVKGSLSVDRRPKHLRVTGFPAEKAESVKQHFAVMSNDIEKDTPESFVIGFPTPSEAQKAIVHGKQYLEHLLNVCFHQPIEVAPMQNVIQTASTVITQAPASSTSMIADVAPTIKSTTPSEADSIIVELDDFNDDDDDVEVLVGDEDNVTTSIQGDNILDDTDEDVLLGDEDAVEMQRSWKR